MSYSYRHTTRVSLECAEALANYRQDCVTISIDVDKDSDEERVPVQERTGPPPAYDRTITGTDVLAPPGARVLANYDTLFFHLVGKGHTVAIMDPAGHRLFTCKNKFFRNWMLDKFVKRITLVNSRGEPVLVSEVRRPKGVPPDYDIRLCGESIGTFHLEDINYCSCDCDPEYPIRIRSVQPEVDQFDYEITLREDIVNCDHYKHTPFMERCCHCPNQHKVFLIHEPSTEEKNGDFVGELHMQWEKKPRLFGVSFPMEMTVKGKALMLMAAVMMHRLYFAPELCGVGVVGVNDARIFNHIFLTTIFIISLPILLTVIVLVFA